MAQVIAPEVWQDGINDNQLLPNRYTVGLFTGRGINIANDGRACRVYDIVTSDYITDYDDRRLNGLSYGNATGRYTGSSAGNYGSSNTQIPFNMDGRDGWGASAYGVFQDVKFTSVVYTMTRHRSTAMRIFEEPQYNAGEYGQADGIGKWGAWNSSTHKYESYISSNGQALLKTAALMSKAKERWQKQVLGPDIDKYVLFAICNGRQNGRLVGKVDTSVTPNINYNDRVFDGDASHYTWQAAPGTVQGEAIPPKFAPIHCIEWDDEHIPQMLQNVKVTWNNLYVDQSDRVVLIDPFYEYALLSALTGSGVPATDSAYNDMKNGSFTKLMGWDFNFEIPSNYWPKIYVDDNLNVIHSADGGEAYDAIINSINGGTGDDKLLRELLASDRMSRTNWWRTEYVPNQGFRKVLTNYPLGSPAYDNYYDTPAIQIGAGMVGSGSDVSWVAAGDYPWDGQGVGYGLKPYDSNQSSYIYPNGAYATGPVLTVRGTSADPVQVIGMFLWKKAAQMSQEYSEMVTDEGRTRGKFQEMCMDVKYDAYVIENHSHAVIPIVNTNPQNVVFSIPVSIENRISTAKLQGASLAKSGSSSSTKLTASVAFDDTPAAPATLHYQWSVPEGFAGTVSDAAELTIGAATGTFGVTVIASGTATGSASATITVS